MSFKPKHMPFRFSLAFTNLQKWDLTYSDPNNPVALVDPLSGDSIQISKIKTFNDKLARHLVVGGVVDKQVNFFTIWIQLHA